MLDDVADLLGLQPEVDGHADPARAAHAEEADEQAGGVLRHDRHPLAGADARARRAGRPGRRASSADLGGR